MKIISFILFAVSASLLVGITVGGISNAYEWNSKIGSWWELADKASTIPAKLEKISRFIEALEAAGLAGTHDAAVFKTPDNSFDENFAALKTLKARLEGMKGMDEKDTAYQLAMDQISAQEVGEAGQMLGVLKGCWWKKNVLYLWDWLGLLIVLGLIGLLFLSFVLAI